MKSKKIRIGLLMFISVLTTAMMVSCGGENGKNGEFDEEGDEVTEEVAESVKPSKPGVLSGVFSISASKKVNFSQGNLQYLPTTKVWKFADNQSDYIGISNADCAVDYDGWIDMFGWGTAGWDNGSSNFDPASTCCFGCSYGTKLYDYDSDLTDANKESDWGVHNAISNGGNTPGMWRTLTKKEWEYLLFKRPRAAQLLALGSVGGVNGLFIFPDDYNTDDFMTLAARDYKYETGAEEVSGWYDKYSDYSSLMSYSRDEFSTLESSGVVFLPAAGHRFKTKVTQVNEAGYYWSATHHGGNDARQFRFEGSGPVLGMSDRGTGSSVRLVMDIQ